MKPVSDGRSRVPRGGPWSLGMADHSPSPLAASARDGAGASRPAESACGRERLEHGRRRAALACLRADAPPGPRTSSPPASGSAGRSRSCSSACPRSGSSRARRARRRCARSGGAGGRWAGARWRVAILAGLWLTELHGGFDRAALDTDFDRTLIAQVGARRASSSSGRSFTTTSLGPRLQRELACRRPSPRRRRARWPTRLASVAGLGASRLTRSTLAVHDAARCALRPDAARRDADRRRPADAAPARSTGWTTRARHLAPPDPRRRGRQLVARPPGGARGDRARGRRRARDGRVLRLPLRRAGRRARPPGDARHRRRGRDERAAHATRRGDHRRRSRRARADHDRRGARISTRASRRSRTSARTSTSRSSRCPSSRRDVLEGALNVRTREPRAFTDAEIALLSSIAVAGRRSRSSTRSSMRRRGGASPSSRRSRGSRRRSRSRSTSRSRSRRSCRRRSSRSTRPARRSSSRTGASRGPRAAPARTRSGCRSAGADGQIGELVVDRDTPFSDDDRAAPRRDRATRPRSRSSTGGWRCAACSPRRSTIASRTTCRPSRRSCASRPGRRASTRARRSATRSTASSRSPPSTRS